MGEKEDISRIFGSMDWSNLSCRPSLVGGVHKDVVSVHLEPRLEGHPADGAGGRRVHALVHSLDVDVHAAEEIGPTELRLDIHGYSF